MSKAVNIIWVSGFCTFDALCRLPRQETDGRGKALAVVKATAGFLIKPTVGFFDGVSALSHGVKATMLYFDDCPNERRKRPCRVFLGEDRIIDFY